ncbi:MAG: hypothetical protein ABIJ18_00115 [archaeon]
MKKYIFAALDFIFDVDEKPYFLEANSVPAGVMELQEVSVRRPIKSLANYMKKYGPNQCFVGPLKKPWIYKELKKDLPELKYCYKESNRHSKIYLTDSKGDKFEPSCIYRHGSLIGRYFEGKIPVINPRTVVHLTSDKDLTYKTVKKVKVNIPKYFVVDNQKELNKVLEKNNFDFILKPVSGSMGRNIHFSKVKIKERMLFQQRIRPKKINNKFWDVRVFVVDGKYSDGIMRVCKSPITNLSLDGKAYKLPKRLENKLRSVSESIVRAIDKKA